MPLILTSSMEANFQGLLLDDLQTIAPEAWKNVTRPALWTAGSMRTSKAQSKLQAKKETDYGWANQRCLHCLPAISAVEDGTKCKSSWMRVARQPCLPMKLPRGAWKDMV